MFMYDFEEKNSLIQLFEHDIPTFNTLEHSLFMMRNSEILSLWNGSMLSISTKSTMLQIKFIMHAEYIICSQRKVNFTVKYSGDRSLINLLCKSGIS